ncbi:unnamed protein product [Sphenostylis stenocarpa]|uniref:Uncharacterized protein n=1 Tax=Sphenostylis stenocarpa TaxID=92480 RepID=A0AA86SDQ4_9FABA|nr:unnamed protein product [Sphenostylis stenocarpa]
MKDKTLVMGAAAFPGGWGGGSGGWGVEVVELITMTVVAGDRRLVVLVQVMVIKEALAGELPPKKQQPGTDGGLEILVVGELKALV